MLFGPIPRIPPRFRPGDAELKYTASTAYVGIKLSSTTHNIFTPHYVDITARARGSALAILGGHAMFGDIPPATLRILYFARVDPHLCSGSDVFIDIDGNLNKLEHVQQNFLRRAMGIFNNRSAVTPLFTEMNVVPIRYRRLTLALRFLRYLLEQDGHRLVRIAFEEQVLMYDAGIPGWLGDLRAALSRLPVRVNFPDITTLRAEGTVDGLIKLVDKSMCMTLAKDIEISPRLYLLRGRLEPQPRGPPQQVLLQLREYLKVRNAQDRAAMSKLMVSSHPLAIEQLRHASGVRNKRKKLAVPRDQRLCRFCNIAIESPEHALLTCEGSAALTALRAEFYAKIQPLRPDLAAAATDVNAQDTLRSLLGAREITSLLAAFVRRTFTIFESVELVWPAQYVITVDTSDESDVGDVVDNE